MLSKIFGTSFKIFAAIVRRRKLYKDLITILKNIIKNKINAGIVNGGNGFTRGLFWSNTVLLESKKISIFQIKINKIKTKIKGKEKRVI